MPSICTGVVDTVRVHDVKFHLTIANKEPSFMRTWNRRQPDNVNLGNIHTSCRSHGLQKFISDELEFRGGHGQCHRGMELLLVCAHESWLTDATQDCD